LLDFVFFVAALLTLGALALGTLARNPLELALMSAAITFFLLPVACTATSWLSGPEHAECGKLPELRSKLRRDLHDGLGPTVATAAMRIDTARRLLAEDPQAVDALLAQAHAEMHDVITNVRELILELRPHPALRGRTLGQALKGLAAQFQQASGGRLHVTVDCPALLPGLTPAVKRTAYHIVSEAVTNVARHAHASQCRIRLIRVARGICINVTDNGVGLPAEPTLGIGTTSMRDRAEEVGGSCLIERRGSGGTLVLAYLPFGPLDHTCERNNAKADG